MKKTILILAVFVTGFAQHSIAQEKPAPVQQLLFDYYNIKDALVAGNANVAAAKAGDFIKTLNGIDYKVISEGNVNVLLKDAGKIAESNDLNKQRVVFSNFSNNVIAVAKAVKLSDKEIYLQYCPMKKASWLSSEKGIKNPYYGSSMLTCGSVKETLK
jgi:hypothetical protein